MLALLVPGVHMGGGLPPVITPTVTPVRASVISRTRERTRWYPVTLGALRRFA